MYLRSSGVGSRDNKPMEVIRDGSSVYGRVGDEPWHVKEIESSTSGEWQLDPWAMLEHLGERGSLVAIGDDEVRGVPVTRFQIAEDSPGETIDVWVDDAGRARRLRTTPNPDGAAPYVAGREGGVRSVFGMTEVPSTIEFWDFGTEVDIVLPDDAAQ